MSAALVAGERVKLIDDDIANRAKFFAESGGGQQDEERFRRGDENMRRSTQHRRSDRSREYRRCAVRRGFGASSMPNSAALRADADERFFKVEPDVVGERLERRDIQDRDFVA